MWVPFLILIAGLGILIWSTDRFLGGAASTAQHLGVSKMIIGLTFVSLGTSAPEILVSLTASLQGTPLLAVGNALGSNIANIGLVLGVTAIIAPLPFSPSTLRSELPWLIGATLLALGLAFDLKLSLLDSLILIVGLSLILYRLIRSTRGKGEKLPDSISAELEELPDLSRGKAFWFMLMGLVLLIGSAQMLVWSATQIAQWLGVSELMIGLTVVAVGTSLPELAATVGAVLKGHTDIAIGNVVGSNIINILAVLAVPGFVATVTIDQVILWRDGGMMLALTLLLALFAYGINSRPVITRFEGAVMLTAWIGYTLLLLQQIPTL